MSARLQADTRQKTSLNSTVFEMLSRAGGFIKEPVPPFKTRTNTIILKHFMSQGRGGRKDFFLLEMGMASP